MSVHNGHVRVVTGAWLRDFSTSGLPVVGGSIYDTSIMHGHSGTSGLFNIRFGDYTIIVTTTLRDDILHNPSRGYVHEPTAPPSFLAVNKEVKSFTIACKIYQSNKRKLKFD
jgi:hypothetical protein